MSDGQVEIKGCQMVIVGGSDGEIGVMAAGQFGGGQVGKWPDVRSQWGRSGRWRNQKVSGGGSDGEMEEC